jgi:outer membrane protein assembly factor BamE (lipoprotein component of BamABCDE complex)
MRVLIPALLSLATLMGCASSGREIEQADVNTIVPGKTTKAEMLERFGQPRGQSYVENGKLGMNWMYVHVGFGGIGGEQQILTVLFDQNDVVEKVTFTGGEDSGVRYGK